MTDKLRKYFAQTYVNMINSGTTRKEAMLHVRAKIRTLNPEYPRSRCQIYIWCKKFGLGVR